MSGGLRVKESAKNANEAFSCSPRQFTRQRSLADWIGLRCGKWLSVADRGKPTGKAFS
jgi:hypothetical protein